jgi:hypothetical protein
MPASFSTVDIDRLDRTDLDTLNDLLQEVENSDCYGCRSNMDSFLPFEEPSKELESLDITSTKIGLDICKDRGIYQKNDSVEKFLSGEEETAAGTLEVVGTNVEIKDQDFRGSGSVKRKQGTHGNQVLSLKSSSRVYPKIHHLFYRPGPMESPQCANTKM